MNWKVQVYEKTMATTIDRSKSNQPESVTKAVALINRETSAQVCLINVTLLGSRPDSCAYKMPGVSFTDAGALIVAGREYNAFNVSNSLYPLLVRARGGVSKLFFIFLKILFVLLFI